MRAALLLLLLTTRANAFYEFTLANKVSLSDLQKTLIANNFSVNYIECTGLQCRIHWLGEETKDPLAIIAAQPPAKDHAALRKTRTARLRTVLSELRAAAITPFQQGVVEALAILAYLVLSDDL